MSSFLIAEQYSVVHMSYIYLGLYNLLVVVEPKAEASIHFSTAGPGKGESSGCRAMPMTKNIPLISGKFLPREDSYALLYPCGKARVYLGAAFLAPGSGCTQA